MTEQRLRELLFPFLVVPEPPGLLLPPNLYPQLATYLDLLLRWNARTNLTAIRDAEEIVTRHFGESLFAALQLRAYLAPRATLLDFGSGAGFPGLPIQLALPAVRVTLAESQGKKAAFLREAVRVLGLETEVWAGRVESMPEEYRFNAVTLRAVDQMKAALVGASKRLLPGGVLVELGSETEEEDIGRLHVSTEQAMIIMAVPLSARRVLRIWKRGG